MCVCAFEVAVKILSFCILQPIRVCVRESKRDSLPLSPPCHIVIVTPSNAIFHMYIYMHIHINIHMKLYSSRASNLLILIL